MTTKVTVTAKGGDVVVTSIMGTERNQSVVKKDEKASFPVHNTLNLEVKANKPAVGSTMKVEATNWPVVVGLTSGKPFDVVAGATETFEFTEAGTLSVREAQAEPEGAE